MSLDPWAALEAQRRRRHWRSWPWGWVALALGLLAWGAFGYAVLLGAAGTRMPGDGAAPQWQASALRVSLIASAVMYPASATSALLGWRLQRARGVAGLAALLLAVPSALLAWAIWAQH
ncbi:hypothetical protein C1924_07480 [Stenotrophomonas sp. ESTM1D_MKCIP4_1]|uniref:hypothetical protein n=1 Tax=Stenotrophomonas sp. ESTM1D_MKCIP4_1 TaxID=2072414 RepID=UPI000D53EB9E|nr:hypothetical protein [Stenotrophomonas sp. ESTM1D_MKCIP4_1]AWH53027.1 hypothetical protein C1924_07480 [Stenotrophomonas sp. ESTM1D_MKCIP4_1]